MRNIQKFAGVATAAALLLGGATAAFAQTATDTYNPSAAVVPSTPLPASTAVTTGTSATVVPSTPSADTTGTTTTTPGVPNTGAGGFAAENLAVLGASAAVALLGGTYLVRRKFAM